VITFRLENLYLRQARQARDAILARLAAGVDTGGKPLKPKVRPNGRPLGGSFIPSRVSAGRLLPRPDGWSVELDRFVTYFDRGRQKQRRKSRRALRRAKMLSRSRYSKGFIGPIWQGRIIQAPRTIAGISNADRRRFRQEAEDEIARQLTRFIERGG